jgi:dipeptidyl aminopeptidase/acylaminoacyl peptidase
MQPEPEVDLAALFAPPTDAEIAAVRAEWAARDTEPDDVRVEGSEEFVLGSVPATLRILSHAIAGGRHYGAVVTADGAAAGSLPVVVYAHGGDQGVSTSELALVAFALGDVSAGFAWVVPSFRSETLRTAEGTRQSGGGASPWDLDVDDAMALLGAALGETPEADADRVGVLGFSRGAGVGLLMGTRDARVDRVVEFFGPTDFFGPYIRTVVEEALEGSLRNLPGLSTLNDRFIQPYAAGSLTVAEARTEFVRRSVVLFAADLPELQIHHGALDEVVEVSQAERLIEVLEAMGRGPPGDGYFVYPGGTHDPITLPGSVERARAFLEALLAPPPPPDSPPADSPPAGSPPAGQLPAVSPPAGTDALIPLRVD